MARSKSHELEALRAMVREREIAGGIPCACWCDCTKVVDVTLARCEACKDNRHVAIPPQDVRAPERPPRPHVGRCTCKECTAWKQAEQEDASC